MAPLVDRSRPRLRAKVRRDRGLHGGRGAGHLHPNIPRLLRHEFAAAEHAGWRSVEAWKRKWEAELRELYVPYGKGRPDRPSEFEEQF
ncbi:hypothetical protein GCM10007067_10120 [Lysobacter bugurensis]|uniref:Uncharacterized protein n=1 Tax=Cognatilysobacter bugurensis TaxID=543356 RepID=A0A918SXE7_9GAMM|nr:hypothetical protein GCM10007067_10120 [Lysobacter bugurensis]